MRFTIRHASVLLYALVTIASAAPARALDRVTIAYIGGTADVGFYIADARGFLKDEGIDANLVVFDSSTRMMAPLATGEIDVASGAVNAATYNALERGIALRAVADKSRNKGIYSYQAVVVRKDLWDSGAVRTLADLKGRRFVTTAQGNNETAILAEIVKNNGLREADIDSTVLSMPQQVAAYANKAIDASILPEPFLSAALKAQSVVSLTPVSAIRDDDVTGVVVYSDKLVNARPDVARRVMKAYVRGLRVYYDALKDARLAGPGAEEVVEIIARYSTIKDKDVLRSVIPHYVDPDGALGVESLTKDWNYFKGQTLIRGDIGVDQLVDRRWVEAAVKDLGPYTRRR